MFFCESSEIFKTRVFQNIPWKMHEVIFFISVKILDSNLYIMIKWLYYRSFLSILPTILEHWQETFFLKSVLLNPEVLDYKPVALENKRQFCKSTLEFLKFCNILSLLSTFRKVSVMEVLVQ